MHNYRTVPSRRRGSPVIFLMVIAQWGAPSSATADEENRRVDLGLLFRFMPSGWMDASEHSPPDIRTFPAVGSALFVDYGLNRFLSVGAMPELTLNVIPKVQGAYPISALVAGSLRLRAQYPGWRYLVPYLLFAPGYSVISSYNKAGPGCACSDYVANGDSHGFILAGYGGARVVVTPRNAVVGEVGYLHGFQTKSSRTYAPSYIVVALGWQVEL